MVTEKKKLDAQDLALIDEFVKGDITLTELMLTSQNQTMERLERMAVKKTQLEEDATVQERKITSLNAEIAALSRQIATLVQERDCVPVTEFNKLRVAFKDMLTQWAWSDGSFNKSAAAAILDYLK